MPQDYDTSKVPLERSEAAPLCPWCDADLTRILWHKVRSGPPVSYVVVLSCYRCRGVLDCLAGGSHAGVMIAAT